MPITESSLHFATIRFALFRFATFRFETFRFETSRFATFRFPSCRAGNPSVHDPDFFLATPSCARYFLCDVFLFDDCLTSVRATSSCARCFLCDVSLLDALLANVCPCNVFLCDVFLRDFLSGRVSCAYVSKRCQTAFRHSGSLNFWCKSERY